MNFKNKKITFTTTISFKGSKLLSDYILNIFVGTG